MNKLTDIVRFLDEELRLKEFCDTSLNGLQVEGSSSVTRLAYAVDAGLAVVEKARLEGANLLLVHHGLLWDKPFRLTGSKRDLIRTLLESEISLYGVHLPLDAHPAFGNNFSLARMLGLCNLKPACRYSGNLIGCLGENSAEKSLEEFERALLTLPGAPRRALTLPFGPQPPRIVAVVSGGGSSALQDQETELFDTLITGEPQQFAYHFAREHKLNVIFAGHYATETIGVTMLAEELKRRFLLPTVFIDFPTGI